MRKSYSTKNEQRLLELIQPYQWIKWVCLGMKPFEFVENPLTREFTKLDPITVPTLKKYLEAVTRKTEAQISSKLPNQFSLIVDGWTKGSDHFVGVFAAWESSLGFESALLAFSPMLSETDFSAVEHKKIIEFVLSVFDKTIENVVAITGDNCQMNKRLATILPAKVC